MREFCEDKMLVLMVPADFCSNTVNGDYPKSSVKEVEFGVLMPESFGPGKV